MGPRLIALIGVVPLAGCAGGNMIYDRPGATNQQASADYLACTDPSREQTSPYVPPQSSIAGAAASGVAQGVLEVQQRHRNAGACMANLGYTQRQLTPPEKARVNAARGSAARDQALDEIMKSNDPS